MILGPSLARNALLHGDKPAIVSADGRSVGHAELHRRVQCLAGGLQRAGVGRGSVVAILARSSAEYLECYFAAALIGAVQVPLNFHLRPADLSARLAHAGCVAVLHDAEFSTLVDQLDPAVREALQGRRWCFDGEVPAAAAYAALLASGTDVPPPCTDDVEAEDTLYIGYTSGTTGPSKGACISHRAVVVGYLYKALAYGLGPDDVSFNPGPFWHSAPRDYASLAVYLGGTCLVTPAFEPTQYLELVQRHGVTNSFLVPTMLQMLLELPDHARYDTRSLRVLLSGGSALAPGLKARVLERFGPCLHEFYGATETRMITSIHADEMRERPKSVGRAFPDVSLRVLDEAGRELPPGGIGEIYIRGPGLFSGYLHDPERTAQASRGPWFTLGDMGRLDEAGYLTLVDRKQDMIISGGENVYPNDIEDVLMACPGVREAAVVGVADPVWGERVTAVIVAQPGAAPNVEALTQACAERLPNYMRPRRYVFDTALPRNPTGKVLRRVLRDRLAEEARAGA